MSEEPKQPIEEPVQPEAAADRKPDEDRRELLKKVGKFAAYTPPALMGLYAVRAVPLPSGLPPSS